MILNSSGLDGAPSYRGPGQATVRDRECKDNPPRSSLPSTHLFPEPRAVPRPPVPRSSTRAPAQASSLQLGMVRPEERSPFTLGRPAAQLGFHGAPATVSQSCEPSRAVPQLLTLPSRTRKNCRSHFRSARKARRCRDRLQELEFRLRNSPNFGSEWGGEGGIWLSMGWKKKLNLNFRRMRQTRDRLLKEEKSLLSSAPCGAAHCTKQLLIFFYWVMFKTSLNEGRYFYITNEGIQIVLVQNRWKNWY